MQIRPRRIQTVPSIYMISYFHTTDAIWGLARCRQRDKLDPTHLCSNENAISTEKLQAVLCRQVDKRQFCYKRCRIRPFNDVGNCSCDLLNRQISRRLLNAVSCLFWCRRVQRKMLMMHPGLIAAIMSGQC